MLVRREMRFVHYNTLAEENFPGIKNLLPDHWYLVQDEYCLDSISDLDLRYKPTLLERLFQITYKIAYTDGLERTV